MDVTGRRTKALLLGMGLLAAVAAAAAIWSIPRGWREFAYIWYDFFDYAPRFRTALFAPMCGFTPEQLSSHVARLVLLGPACVLIGLAIGGRAARWKPPAWMGPAAIVTGATLVLLAAVLVMRGIPLQDDEATYLFQGRIFADGNLLAPSVPGIARFQEAFTIFTDEGTTGKYLFGEPLLLAFGILVGFPLLLHVVLAAATVAFVRLASRRESSDAFANGAAMLLAVSPGFVMTTACPLSQAPALAAVAAAVWAVGRGKWMGGLWAGLAVGLAMASRPQVALPAGVVIGAMALWSDRRALGGMIIGILPSAVAILAYNAAVTGDPLVLPWALAGSEQFGFGPEVAPGISHTVGDGLLAAVFAAVRLNGWALGWPVSLAAPIAWLACGMPRRKAVAPWAWIAVATFVFHMGYYSIGTSDTGAIYHHAAIPFFALSAAAVVEKLAATRWRGMAAGILVSMVLFGTVSFFIEHSARLVRLTDRIAAAAPATPHDRPTLVLQERFPAGRPTAGWVWGIPFRPRSPYDSVVRFPRASGPSVAHLRTVWIGRECLYQWFDYESRAAREVPCDEMGPIVARVAASQRADDYPSPDDLDGRKQVEGWQYAFPWMPLVGWANHM